MIPLVARLDSDERLSWAMASDIEVVQVRGDCGYMNEPLVELC